MSALEAEAEMPLEELLALYRRGSPSPSPASPPSPSAGPLAPLQSPPAVAPAPAAPAAPAPLAEAQAEPDVSMQEASAPGIPTDAPEAGLGAAAGAEQQAKPDVSMQDVSGPGSPEAARAAGQEAAAGAEPKQQTEPAGVSEPAAPIPAQAADDAKPRFEHPTQGAVGALRMLGSQSQPGSAEEPSKGMKPATRGAKGRMAEEVAAASMEDAAALASSAQPTGYTLQTTSVHTKVRCLVLEKVMPEG